MDWEFPYERIAAAQEAGARCLQRAGQTPERPETAVVAEQHRWAWRPENPRIILIAASRVYTTAAEAALTVLRERLPVPAQQTPPGFARLIYCLGYGEPELLSDTLKANFGNRDLWNAFGRLAGLGNQPSSGMQLSLRLNWKVEVLLALQQRGVWLLDASLHGLLGVKGERVPSEVGTELHRLWWQHYGSWLLERLPGAGIWGVGQEIGALLTEFGCRHNGCIELPGVTQSGAEAERGWADLFAAATGSRG